MHGQVGEAALEVRALSAGYGGPPVLSGVCLRVDPGELVALVGPNGAGKSTLVRAVLGLHPHDGQVVVHGRASSERRTRLAAAYVPQRLAVDLDFPITVEQVVAAGRRPFRRLFGRPRPSDRQAVARALALVELDGLGEQSIGSLSGGQQQRAFVARALAQEADVLLLDEPLAGVDAGASAELLELLERLAREHVALLVATHDLTLVRARFARCVVLNGRVVADGRPAEVLDGVALESVLGFGSRVAA